MNKMREIIFKKLEEVQRSVPSINKFFIFNLEDLEDNPESCLNQIEEYLEKHKDKVKDIEFETWIDEETFCPVVMLKMFPVDSIGKYLFRANILNSLLPPETEARILREKVQNILLKYNWEFNDEETRKSMISDLCFALSIDKIVDRTTLENIDNGIINFFVEEAGEELTISQYLDIVGKKKRFKESD